VDIGELTSTTVTQSFNTNSGTEYYEPGCTGISGRERVIAFSLDQESDVTLDWTQSGDHVFGLMFEGGGACDENQAACYDPYRAPAGSTTFNRLAAGDYILIVDAHDPGGEGFVKVDLTAN
jgi:hypothetical protein